MGQVHARAVRSAGGIVAAVAARSQRAADAAANGFAADRAYCDVEQLVTSNDVDIVHVCTPNDSHAELVGMALAAGKHVICEKPLATTQEQARTLTEAAARTSLINAVPFVYRYYASVREVRARVQRGDAGPLRLVHGSYLQDWLSRPEETNWRVDPTLGGESRAFGDIGVHWCDVVEFTTGHRISRLCATLFTMPRGGVTGGPRTEDAATVIFQTDQDAVGSVVISQVSPGRKNRLWFSLDGAQASYQFNQEMPDTLWIGGREQSIVLARATGAAIAPAVYDMVPAGHPQGYQDSFTAFITDVHHAILGEKPDGLPTFTDGLRAATITSAVLKSAATGGWVEVDDGSQLN